MNHARTPSLALGFVLALIPCARGQSVLQIYSGEQQYSSFGDRATHLGDVDGDGVGDYLIGAPLEDSPHDQTGRAYVYSGATQTLLRTHAGEGSYDLLGLTLAGPGDVDGDGLADYAIGSHRGGPHGYVDMFSGVDGSLLWRLSAGTFEGYFGFSLAVLDDMDGDGARELAIGIPHYSPSVRVVSGATGATLYTAPSGSNQSNEFGWSLASVPDVDGDGFADFWVGARGASNALPAIGFVRLISGLTGAQLLQIDGHQLNAEFGGIITNAGDATGDGIAELLVVEIKLSRAYLYDGATGAELWNYALHLATWDRRVSITGVGDLNGDGRDDHAIGTSLDCQGALCSGRVRIYSGLDGSLLMQLTGHGSEAPYQRFGAHVQGIDDVDQDGVRDLLVGSRWGPEPFAGELRVISLGPCVSPTNYCSTSPNSAGPGALMGSLGTTSVDLDDFSLIATGAPPDKVGIFFYGAQAGQAPLGNGTRCVALPLFRLRPPQTCDAAGTALMKLRLWGPGAPHGSGAILAGSTWRFQFWYRDPAAGGWGFNVSDGLEVPFCP